MKKIFFTVLFLAHFVAFAQEQKNLVISFGTGWAYTKAYNSLQNPQVGIAYGLDVDYKLSQKSVFSVAYYYASNDYFYDYSAKIGQLEVKPANQDTNSTISFNSFSLLYKYKILEKHKLDVFLGLGLSMQNVKKISPEAVLYSLNNSYGVIPNTYANLEMAFPFKLDVNYWIHKNWALGVQTGVYYMPENPISAFIQPKISFCIK